MTSLRSPSPRFSLPTGIAAAILAMALFAPTAAEAGCSHLVTSRADAAGRDALVEPLVRDLGDMGGGGSGSAPRRPCTGAWCTGQPAVPPAAPGVFEVHLGSWAWCCIISNDPAIACDQLRTQSENPRPSWSGSDVFHPPRSVAPA